MRRCWNRRTRCLRLRLQNLGEWLQVQPGKHIMSFAMAVQCPRSPIIALQYFNPSLCRCHCSDREAMAQCYAETANAGASDPLKIWDEENCACRCAETFRECSTGYVYDQMDTCSCVPELRPASSVPVVALVVALIGTLTCLVLVGFNYRRTRKVLFNIQRQNRLHRQMSSVSSGNNNGNACGVGDQIGDASQKEAAPAEVKLI